MPIRPCATRNFPFLTAGWPVRFTFDHFQIFVWLLHLQETGCVPSQLFLAQNVSKTNRAWPASMNSYQQDMITQKWRQFQMPAFMHFWNGKLVRSYPRPPPRLPQRAELPHRAPTAGRGEIVLQAKDAECDWLGDQKYRCGEAGSDYSTK
jgi:hypothetical protein